MLKAKTFALYTTAFFILIYEKLLCFLGFHKDDPEAIRWWSAGNTVNKCLRCHAEIKENTWFKKTACLLGIHKSDKDYGIRWRDKIPISDCRRCKKRLVHPSLKRK